MQSRGIRRLEDPKFANSPTACLSAGRDKLLSRVGEVLPEAGTFPTSRADQSYYISEAQ